MLQNGTSESLTPRQLGCTQKSTNEDSSSSEKEEEPRNHASKPKEMSKTVKKSSKHEKKSPLSQIACRWLSRRSEICRSKTNSLKLMKKNGASRITVKKVLGRILAALQRRHNRNHEKAAETAFFVCNQSLRC